MVDANQEDDLTDGRVQHVVLFDFPERLTDEEETEMFSMVTAWRDDIPGLTGLRLGRDVGGRADGFDYLLLTEFEDEAAHQAYYGHPDHVRFSEWVGERNCRVLRVDYPLDEKSLIL